MTFAIEGFRHSGPVLCAGLDPSASILTAWGLSDTPEGLTQWVSLAVDAVENSGVRVVKPQIAFFERHGLAGMRALAQLMGTLRARGVFVIADAKRGDIGPSVEGYAEAWLTPGGDFEADALTLHPFHGVGSLVPAMSLAHTHEKTVFVLVATSNPEARELQAAVTHSGQSVSQRILHELSTYATEHALSSSAVGAVVGATIDHEASGLGLEAFPDLPILAPGYGAQGADIATAANAFPDHNCVLPVSARALLDGGPQEFVTRTQAAIGAVESR